jgi:hypothetical protein
MNRVPFPRPLTEKTADQARRTILRGALRQMGMVRPGNGDAYNKRLLSLKAKDLCAFGLFCFLSDALRQAVNASGQEQEEQEARQFARDWLDAFDAYIDRKYPVAEKPGPTEPSAPASAKDSGPEAFFGREQVLEAISHLDNLKLARKRLPQLQALTAGTGICSFMTNVLNELELHRDALKRANLLKP